MMNGDRIVVPLEEAVRFCNAMSAITLDDAGVAEAMTLYQGEGG